MSSSPTKPFGAGRGEGESVRSPYEKASQFARLMRPRETGQPPIPRMAPMTIRRRRAFWCRRVTRSASRISPTLPTARCSSRNPQSRKASAGRPSAGAARPLPRPSTLEGSRPTISICSAWKRACAACSGRPPSAGCARPPTSSPSVMRPETQEFSAVVPILTSTVTECRRLCSLRFSRHRRSSARATAACGPS